MALQGLRGAKGLSHILSGNAWLLHSQGEPLLARPQGGEAKLWLLGSRELAEYYARRLADYAQDIWALPADHCALLCCCNIARRQGITEALLLHAADQQEVIALSEILLGLLN